MKWAYILLAVFIATPALADAPPIQPIPPAVPKILVLPFETLGDASHAWVGRAVQQSLYTDLSHNHLWQPITAATAGAIDDGAAIASAKGLGAQFVVFGACQFVDDHLRISGQIISVDTGQAVGTLRSNSILRDLFEMEDNLGGQAARVLAVAIKIPEQNQTVNRAPSPANSQFTPNVPAQTGYFPGSNLQRSLDNPNPLNVPSNTVYDNYDSNAGYFPSYGYYGGYGYGGGPVVVVVNDDGHHHHHHQESCNGFFNVSGSFANGNVRATFGNSAMATQSYPNIPSNYAIAPRNFAGRR